MKLLRLTTLFAMLFGITYGQDNFDVNKFKADPNTFIFDDGKHTVQGFIYSTLESKTKCCGTDAIYLEVKIDQSGNVVSTKSLTGKNDCYKKSVEDIVKSIKWNAATIKSTKSVFFEVKPVTACKNVANENQYVAVNMGGSTLVVNETKTEVKTETKTETKVENNTPQVTVAKMDSSKILPKQKYVSKGNLKPDSSHIKTTANLPGPTVGLPVYADGGDHKMAYFVKSSLRKAGVCGLAHVLAEITINKDGSVKSFRLFNTNSADLEAKIPAIINSLKFNSLVMEKNVYWEFKADIDCSGKSEGKVDLSTISPYFRFE